MRSSQRHLLFLSLLLAGCAKGGGNEIPGSAVKITGDHHLFGMRTVPGFGTFPVTPDDSAMDHGLLRTNQDSTYVVIRNGTTSPSDRYALDTNGVFTVYSTGTGRNPTVAMAGGYGQVAVTNTDLFFTDRFASSATGLLGLYVGTKVIDGQADVSGDWHAFSLHMLYASTTAGPNASLVARGMHGECTVSTGASGTLLDITGTGRDSAGADLALGGTVQAVLSGTPATGNGALNLMLRYRELPGGVNDDRQMHAAAGKDLILAMDPESSGGSAHDGEAGLLVMFRKFATGTPAALAQVAGTYLVGTHTVFVNPSNSGSDAAVGKLSLTTGGNFTFTMVGSRNIDFTYSGTFQLADDGLLVFSVSGTGETWRGAIHRDYNTIVVNDDVVEFRTNPELNLFVGVREKTP